MISRILIPLLLCSCLAPKHNNKLLTKASPKLEIYAHRGDFKFYAENTIEAIKEAFEKSKINPSIVGAELDVQITKDGKIIVLHDSTIARTARNLTPEQNLVKDVSVENLNYAQIKDVQVGPKKSDTIAELKDVIELIRKDYPKKKLLIELKSYDNAPEELSNRMLKSLEETIGAFSEDVKSRLSFISFDEGILEKLPTKKALEEIDRYAIYEKSDFDKLSDEELQAKLKNLKKKSFTGIDLEMGDYLERKPLVRFAKENNLRVITWPYFTKKDLTVQFMKQLLELQELIYSPPTYLLTLLLRGA